MVTEFESWAGEYEEPITVRVDYYKPEVPGKLDGPWEDCHPDEPEELSYTVFHADGTVYRRALTEKESARIYEKCIQKLESMEEPV